MFVVVISYPEVTIAGDGSVVDVTTTNVCAAGTE